MASVVRVVDFGTRAPPNLESQQPMNALSWETMRLHAPQAQLVAVDDAGRLLAHASVWWNSTARLEHRPTGVVGHYGAKNAHAGTMVLNEACARLAAQKCVHVIGPMDGNPWRRYRFLTQRGDEPIFFLEPDNPDEWPGHFTSAGFTPLASYFSSVAGDLSDDDPRVDATVNRLRDQGVAIRPVNLDRFDQELEAIHRLSLEAFAGNFLYSPISRDEFVEMYRPVRQFLSPEMVWLAEQGREGDRELIGFMFAIPDINQIRRGQRLDTAIAKSIAVKPGCDGAGLGGALIELARRAARNMGMRRVIYALMHEGNRSTRMAARFGKPFRRYTLYSRQISRQVSR